MGIRCSHYRLFQLLSQLNHLAVKVTPQFEVGKEKIGKNGIVTEEQYHDEAIKKIISFIKDNSYKLIGVEESREETLRPGEAVVVMRWCTFFVDMRHGRRLH